MTNLRIGMLAGTVGVLAALGTNMPAMAAEARVGLMAHDLDLGNENRGGKENGPSVSLQASFDAPDLLRPLGSPRPWVLASVNLAGDTSFAGAGLAWRLEPTRGPYVEGGLGYVVHDGITTLPDDPGDPVRIERDRTRTILGSRDLFRTHVAIGTRVGARWSAELVYEHLSHGQILGQGRNEGLDNIGIKIGWRFGD
jgi:lipid A 3-O-deacylase